MKKSFEIKRELHKRFPKSNGWKFKVRCVFEAGKTTNRGMYDVYIEQGPILFFDYNNVLSYQNAILLRTKNFIEHTNSDEAMKFIEEVQYIEADLHVMLYVYQGTVHKRFVQYGTLKDKMKLI